MTDQNQMLEISSFDADAEAIAEFAAKIEPDTDGVIVVTLKSCGTSGPGGKPRYAATIPGIGSIGRFTIAPLSEVCRALIKAGVNGSRLITQITAPSTVRSFVPAPISSWAEVTISEGDRGIRSIRWHPYPSKATE